MSTTAARVRELFSYDRETGVFTRLIRTAQTTKPGEVAGYLLGGYRKLKIDHVSYLAHRVAWLWVYGEWPKQQIDHIDCDKLNNRIANLRDVSQSVNQQNRRWARRDATTGLLGAHLHLKKYKAAIGVGGKSVHVGLYETPQQAHEAYLEAKRRLHAGSTL